MVKALIFDIDNTLVPHGAPADEKAIRLFERLKKIGYQVGAGLMVGAPGQTLEHLLDDIHFMQRLQPDMIGIGPYLRHSDTPFGRSSAQCAQGLYREQKLELTLRLLAVLRILFPYALIPSTTALGTIDPQGRVLGLKAGANVVMPNLSPSGVREKYLLYDNKICTGEESAECRGCLENRMRSIGYEISLTRGDIQK